MESRKEYLNNYHSKNIVQKKINFNRQNKTDMEILEFVEKKKNFSKYAKELISKDMINEK